MGRLSPQEKKLLSYTKDRRSDYSANAKASRRLVPLRKRLASRGERKLSSEAVAEYDFRDPDSVDVVSRKLSGSSLPRLDFERMRTFRSVNTSSVSSTSARCVRAGGTSGDNSGSWSPGVGAGLRPRASSRLNDAR